MRYALLPRWLIGTIVDMRSRFAAAGNCAMVTLSRVVPYEDAAKPRSMRLRLSALWATWVILQAYRHPKNGSALDLPKRAMGLITPNRRCEHLSVHFNVIQDCPVSSHMLLMFSTLR